MSVANTVDVIMYDTPPKSYAQRLAEDGDSDIFDYKSNQAYETLKPHKTFLNLVMKYYEENSQSISWKPAPQNQSRGTSGNNVGFWIDIDDLLVIKKIGDDEIREVYEYDPSQDVSRRDFWQPQYKIEITDYNIDEMQARLKRKPTKPKLRIRPNLVHIKREIYAINEISNKPKRPQHDGLLMLLHSKSHVRWPVIEEGAEPEWRILTEDREGSDEQRQFVKVAMATPDFALLSGPPGSGKTTAICELVLQLIAEGKRVLFCASTHVAIDNLLERLIDDKGVPAKNLLPIRIGSSPKISERVTPFFYTNFVKTKTKAMKQRLQNIPNRTDSQNAMLNSLTNNDTVGEMARKYANFICGTPIGILSYFKQAPDARFDYLIVDEASKTTFHEFLVPALRAQRWIIVGDTRQLVPHTDQDEIAVNVNACLPDIKHANVCLDVFAAKRYGNTTIVVSEDASLLEAYRRQCEMCNVTMDAHPGKLEYGRIVTCPAKSVPSLLDGSSVALRYTKSATISPKHRVVVRDYSQSLDDMDMAKSTKQGRRILKKIQKKQSEFQGYTWGHELGWRIAIHQPHIQSREASHGIDDDKHADIQLLMPADKNSELEDNINNIRRVALPSILELMRYGYDPGPNGRDAALVQGMPDDAHDRHVLLSYQHRMHPDIAKFSHNHIYDSMALKSPPTMAEKRMWKYDRYPRRCVWIDVEDSRNNRASDRTNMAEVRRIIHEIHQFRDFAIKNPKNDGTPWEVAVLAFYTHQWRVLQQELAKSLGITRASYTFRIPSNKPNIVINLRTVDSFQGHESDIVFITMTKPHPTPFLNNPNRLNVALTRARYQCVIVGDPRLADSGHPLGTLASETPKVVIQ